MPHRRETLVRKTSLALGAGAVLLLGIVAFSIYLAYSTQDHMERAIGARQLRSAAADLLLAVQTAESGQRGYLLTTRQDFLDPYVEAINQIEQRKGEFEKALESASYILVDPVMVRQAVNNKAAELRQTLALAQEGKLDEALNVLRSEYGLRLMNNIRSILQGIIEASDREIEAQLSANVELATLLRLSTMVGALAIIAIMTAVVLVIRRYLQEIIAARTELEVMNASLEERVRERTEDLIQANQEIQRFAYIVTHDLRAPLVNIMGFTAELDAALGAITGYFDEDGEQPNDGKREQALVAVREDLPEAIQFIRTSTRKMDDLINAILKISRDGRRPLKPERIDLEAILKQSADAVQHQVQAADGSIGIDVRLRSFISDRFSIEQIFGNLLDNAVKYRDPSRPLEVRISAYPVSHLMVGIECADNGRGIAPEDHERVFELFRRSGTQTSPGEGIGLAHVRSLVRNMGGDINVRSELGKGTTFVIRLPMDLSRFVGSHGQ